MVSEGGLNTNVIFIICNSYLSFWLVAKWRVQLAKCALDNNYIHFRSDWLHNLGSVVIIDHYLHFIFVNFVLWWCFSRSLPYQLISLSTTFRHESMSRLKQTIHETILYNCGHIRPFRAHYRSFWGYFRQFRSVSDPFGTVPDPLLAVSGLDWSLRFFIGRFRFFLGRFRFFLGILGFLGPFNHFGTPWMIKKFNAYILKHSSFKLRYFWTFCGALDL